LHPYAIVVLAGLLKSTSEQTQVIACTQSVTLLNQLDPGALIVADRVDGASVFRRPTEEDMAVWLDGYALGDVWEKNVIGGRPR
jgi:predicted ATPase